jgi:rod shape-determining protein MreB
VSRAAHAAAAGVGGAVSRVQRGIRWLRTPNDVAIDLGTTHTRVARRGECEFELQASVVALRTDARGEPAVLAVGNEARRMLGRTPPSVRAVRPLQNGALADLQATELLLRQAIARALLHRAPLRPRVAIAMATGITSVERRALREAAVSAGARQVHLIPSPLAAAIGAGFPVDQPRGRMIVDVGGGMTEVAVIALGGIVCGRGVRVGGDAMNQAIRASVRRRFDLAIGDEVSELIKVELGRAGCSADGRTLVVHGSDLLSRRPRAVELGSDDVKDALADPLAVILRETHGVLERVPPELAADLAETGITLTGGGSLLPGLDVRLAESTGLPVARTLDPYASVVLGCCRCLESPALLEEVAIG